MTGAPKAAVKLVDDAVAGGWPPEWIETRHDTWPPGGGPDKHWHLYWVVVEDRSCSDRWHACWQKEGDEPWRFTYAHDGDGKMTLTCLRSFVCNGPMEVV